MLSRLGRYQLLSGVVVPGLKPQRIIEELRDSSPEVLASEISLR